MTYTEAMTMIGRLRSLIVAGGDDSVYTTEDRMIIEALSLSELGKRVRQCNCHDRYIDAVIELYHTLKKRGIMAIEKKYTLRAGVLIWVGTTVYTNANLTDEVAAAYLEMHPESRSKFERVPADYVAPAEEELIAQAKASKSKRAKKAAQEE